MPPLSTHTPEEAFELLAGLTARLASTANLDEITSTVANEIAALGFGAVWIAALDEPSGNLLTIREQIDGRDTTHEMPAIFMLDTRQPIGHGFRERRMINIRAPEELLIIEEHPGPIPPDRMALPRVIYEHLRGHPFACGPLLGSRGQPVGALGLSSYRGHEPIPDELFSHGLLRAFMNHLGIAMERALHLARLERVNTALVRAQEALERESRVRAVGELATAVAHDLNNLASIMILSATLGRRSPQAALEMLPRIESASRATGELARRLQVVARTGVEASGAPVDLDEVVADIVLMLGPVCREESIALSVERSGHATVVADAGMVRQSILNLVMNAREALAAVAPERRRLRLTTVTSGEQVHLIVRDSGPGLPAEMVSQLFEPFATTKGTGHPGLGLASVRAAMKHFGGGVSARNEPDGGAAFDLAFTRASAATLPAAPPELPRPAPPSPTARRVLIVDDEPDVADLVRTCLDLLGHRTFTAATAAQAQAVLDREALDLVLCDFGLPGVNGLDLCVQVHAARPEVKLVLMTGWDQRVVEADPRVAACAAVLQKPIEQAELAALLDQLFHHAA